MYKILIIARGYYLTHSISVHTQVIEFDSLEAAKIAVAKVRAENKAIGGIHVIALFEE